jgi:acyl-coenzyme A thioesterase PaaI-like protein
MWMAHLDEDITLPPLATKALQAMKEAVAAAIAEHWRAGRPVHIWRDEQVVALYPDGTTRPSKEAFSMTDVNSALNFNAALGLRPGDEPGTLVLDPRPEHQVAPDVIHFAILTTLAEISAAGAVGASVVPATVTVHLLSRARLAPLVGRGKLLRKGKKLAVAEGEVTQDGQLVAKATVQFAVLG